MKLLYFLLLATLLSCTKKVTNDPIDVAQAKYLADEFYKKTSTRDVNYVDKYVDESIGKEKFLNTLDKHYESYGKLKEKKIWEVETEHTSTREGEEILYKIFLNVTSEKDKTHESLGFIKKDNSIKLISYYYNTPKYR